MNYEVEKINTDNPLLDEIVYNCKIMMLGTILKNEEKANKHETLESIRTSDLYMISYEKKSRFIDYEYDIDFLKTCPYIPSYKIIEYANDNSKIAQSFRTKLVEDMQKYYVKNYVEQNDYYRTLNGLPPYQTPGVKLDDLDLSFLPKDYVFGANVKYLHELDNSTIELFQTAGVIDSLKTQYPNLKYFDYLGANKIDIYGARKALNFGILRVPTPSSIEVYNRYLYFLNINRTYFIKRVYTESYKFLSDHYDEVMMMLIVMTTFLDCIAELPEYYIRKDIFDIRTIKYLFEANGVKYFEDIPIKYQLRMVRNINRLIKYKSTNRGIADICSIFGYDNIEIFKYYIMRDRKCTSDGTYVYAHKFDEVTQTLIEDPEAEYELKFLKTPIDGIADDYIRDPMNIMDYDDVTLGDKLWDGPYVHNEIKKQIIEKEFSIELSKYISIDTVYELTEMNFDLPYFINMIMFSGVNTDKLACNIPNLSQSKNFQLTDLLVYLYALMYRYLGVKDRIFDERSQVLSVLGFNFELDLSNLVNWLAERGETLESLGVDSFDFAPNGIMTFPQLVNIFITNKNVHEVVKKGMINAQSKEEYEIYKKLYQSLFITELNWEYYHLPSDPEQRKKYTYTDFLYTKDPVLYDSLKEIDDLTNQDARIKKVSNLMGLVVSKVEELLDTNILDTIFTNIPTVSVDYVKNYMFKVINFFKSYKVSLLEINTIYKFDDDLNNRIFFIDHIHELVHTHDYIDIGVITDKIINSSYFESEDIYKLREKLYMIKEYYTQLNTNDGNIFEDIINDLTSAFTKRDDVIPNDEINYLIIEILKTDWVALYEQIAGMLVTLKYEEHSEFIDNIHELTRLFSRLVLDNHHIFDTVFIKVYKQLDEFINYQYKNALHDNHSGMYDMIYEYYYLYDKTDYVKLHERFNKLLSVFTLNDKYIIKDACYIRRTYE